MHPMSSEQPVQEATASQVSSPATESKLNVDTVTESLDRLSTNDSPSTQCIAEVQTVEPAQAKTEDWDAPVDEVEVKPQPPTSVQTTAPDQSEGPVAKTDNQAPGSTPTTVIADEKSADSTTGIDPQPKPKLNRKRKPYFKKSSGKNYYKKEGFPASSNSGSSTTANLAEGKDAATKTSSITVSTHASQQDLETHKPLAPVVQNGISPPQLSFQGPTQAMTIIRTLNTDGTGYIERIYPHPARQSSFYNDPFYRPNYLEYFPPSDYNQFNLPQQPQQFSGSNPNHTVVHKRFVSAPTGAATPPPPANNNNNSTCINSDPNEDQENQVSTFEKHRGPQQRFNRRYNFKPRFYNNSNPNNKYYGNRSYKKPQKPLQENNDNKKNELAEQADARTTTT